MLSGRTDTEAEVTVFWSSDVYSQVTGKSLLLGSEGRKRKRHQRMRLLDGITDAMDMNLGTSGDDEGWGAWCPAVPGAKKSWT